MTDQIEQQTLTIQRLQAKVAELENRLSKKERDFKTANWIIGTLNRVHGLENNKKILKDAERAFKTRQMEDEAAELYQARKAVDG